MVSKYFILLIYLSFLAISSFAEDTQMVFSSKPDCQLFEIDDKGQWKEVSSEFIKNKTIIVSSNAVQPNHYYFVQQDRWFSALKNCFQKPGSVAKKYPKETLADKSGESKVVVNTPSSDLGALDNALSDSNTNTKIESSNLEENAQEAARIRAEAKAHQAKIAEEKKRLKKLQLEAAKAEAARKEAEKAAARAEVARKKAALKKDAVKAEAARIAALRAESAKAEAAKIAAAKAEVVRQESAKQEELRQELAKQQQETAVAKAAAKAAAKTNAKQTQITKKVQNLNEDIETFQPVNKSSFFSKFKTSIIAGGFWWTDTFYITANNTMTPIDIIAKQTGILVGASFLNPYLSDTLKYSATVGFVYALSRTSSKIASVTYDTNGISIYGGYISGTLHYSFSSQSNVLIGLEPFLLYRSGEWVTPAPNGRITYTLQDQAALRYGALFELRNNLSNKVYLSPKVGFFQQIDNLTFQVNLGVGL